MTGAGHTLCQVGDEADGDVEVVAPAVTGAVTAAFALGWQMARLYGGPLSSNAEPKVEADLPGLSGLPPASLVTLGLAQVDVGLGYLQSFLGDHTTLPTTNATRAEVAEEGADADSIRKAILDLHVQLLIDLTAADYRLGKAYGLGRALADTCASADGDPAQRKKALLHQLEPHRALVLVGWMDDLKTVLPPHSGQAVADSLQRWTRWGESADLGSLDAKTVNATTRVLHRCGQRWRAILSAEKNARDLLETNDYVDAARRMLARCGAIGRAVAWQLKVPLGAATLLIVLGLVLMFLNHSTAQVLGGLGTVAGGLGITWRSVATALGRVSLDIGRPLWSAEVDVVIASRLTPEPQRDHVVELPRQTMDEAGVEQKPTTADPTTPQGDLPAPDAPPPVAGDGGAAV